MKAKDFKGQKVTYNAIFHGVVFSFEKNVLSLLFKQPWILTKLGKLTAATSQIQNARLQLLYLSGP